MQWTLDLPYERPPLNANQRLHWAKKAALTKQVRAASFYAAKSAGVLRCDKVRVTLTWFVRTTTRRDADNVVPTLKALCDGLVDAGIVSDDTPDQMVKVMPVIVYRPNQPAGLQLLIEEVYDHAV
jgi:crossover junction endodeoxyribonuclease RusA